jgi:PadR family transcriptional regulator
VPRHPGYLSDGTVDHVDRGRILDEPGSGAVAGSRAARRCRFALAAPRHFVYPAVLLLLAEEPRHGYRLMDALLALGFGPFDRPTVYRALADLESDGLLESWPAKPTAGGTRHVYGPTEAGRAALAEWMGTLDEERTKLERILVRFAKVCPELSGGTGAP